MGTRANHGFTIIEVMLFLAVTGALTVGILAGAGVSISQQRYRDSVSTLKSFIQTQYSEVANVINDRNQDWTCNAGAAVAETSVGTGQPRGTSDCVMLGRLVTVDSTGKILASSNVVGYRIAGTPTGGSDIAELQNYAMTASPIDTETKDVSWGAQITKPDGSGPQPGSILILHSPLSGAIVTFTMSGIQTSAITAMITKENMKDPLHLCVRPDVGTFVGKVLEVRIDKYAASQSAVLVPVETESVCN